MIDFTDTQTTKTHRERAGGAAMVDTDTFISALDALEILQQRIVDLSNRSENNAPSVFGLTNIISQLQRRIMELEAALRDISHGPVGCWNEPQHREATIAYMMQRADEVLVSNKEVE